MKYLVDKVQKRQFEVTIEQLTQSFTALEARVINSLPAMQYEIKNGLKRSVSFEQLAEAINTRASLDFVEVLTNRFNKL